jgi:hypothetical protein
VKRALLKYLEHSAPCGCPEALSLVKSCLDDSNTDVCEMAVEVLLVLAKPGDDEIMELLQKIRADVDVQVQDAIDNGLESYNERAQDCEVVSAVDLESMPVEEVLDVYDGTVVREKALELLSPLGSDASSDTDTSSSDVSTSGMQKAAFKYKDIVALHDKLEDQFGSASSTQSSLSSQDESEELTSLDKDFPVSDALTRSATVLSDMKVQDVLSLYDKIVAKEAALTNAHDNTADLSDASDCKESDGMESHALSSDFEVVPVNSDMELPDTVSEESHSSGYPAQTPKKREDAVMPAGYLSAPGREDRRMSGELESSWELV